MQRAAIARALIGQPEVLLADEPTGNLDAVTGREIMNLMTRLNEEQGLTIIMVTHDETIARQANRIVRLTEGRIPGAGRGCVNPGFANRVRASGDSSACELRTPLSFPAPCFIVRPSCPSGTLTPSRFPCLS